MIEYYLSLFGIAISCTFVAYVITMSEGPLFVFSWFRMKIGVWVAAMSLACGKVVNSDETKLKKWLAMLASKIAKSLGVLINCPYCLVPWLTLVALIGSKSLLQSWLITSGMAYLCLGIINGNNH